MKILDKMQRRAAIWILGAFKTLPATGIEAITGIIPIKFHLQKITKRLQIRPFKLLSNHIIRNLMDDLPPSSTTSNLHKIGSLTNQQRTQTKGHLTNLYNKSLEIFPSFSPGNRIIDNFSDRFSLLVNRKEKTKINNRVLELDEIVLQASSSPHIALVITDASIKNNIATSVSHIHSMNSPLTKTAHHASFVTSTEAELFAIRCSINQACSKENILKIIIVTDSIHTAKKIFDSNSHLYQLHSIAILRKLQEFFNSNPNNTIEFWECPSRLKWRFHRDVDKDSKSFYPAPSYPCKTSWDFCKKTDSDNIIKQWKMTFQASDGKGNHFLDLLDDDLNPIEPLNIKGGPWLQSFGHSNSLCAQATRAITNHAPIGEYRLRFLPNMDFSCPCNNYPIESRRYILHECKRFNGYWNPRRDTLSHFVMFLITNPNAFAFINS